MHSIFTVPDVLRDMGQSMEFPDLVRFSRTCMLVHFSIKELVWSNQKSMRSLVAVLPPDLVVPEAVQEMQMTLDGPSDAFPDDQVSIIPPDLRILEEPQPPEGEEPVEVEVNNDQGDEVDEQWEELPDEAQEPVPEPTVEETRDQRVLIFKRPPTIEDLTILVERSRHVKHIMHTCKETKAFLVFNALLRLFPQVEFFPILRRASLGWSEEPYSRFHHILIPHSLLLISSLDSISMEYATSNPYRQWGSVEANPGGITDALNTLTRHCPPNKVRTVAHRVQQPGPDTALLLSRWVVSFKNFIFTQSRSLQELILDRFSSRGLKEILLLLPNMVNLDLGSPLMKRWANEDDPNEQAEPVPISLPQVTRLTMRNGQTAIFLKTKKISFPNAHEVDVQLTHNGGLWMIGGHPVTHALDFVSTNTPSVRSILIETTFSGPYTSRINRGFDLTLSGDLLLPLLANHSLERLEFACGSALTFTLDDETLIKMASAWPSLSHLFLSPQNTSKSTVSFHKLAEVAQLCPRLEVLGFPINPSVEHFIAASDIDQFANSNSIFEGGEHSLPMCPRPIMKRLNIDAPRLIETNETIVAEFLMSIFPRLKHIYIPKLPPRKLIPQEPEPIYFNPPVPMQPPPAPAPPPSDPEREARRQVLKTWRHVAFIASEMRRQGTKNVAEILRQSARSNIIQHVDTERVLIQQEDDDDEYYMDGDGDEEDIAMSD